MDERMNKLGKAIKMAAEVHEGQFDKAGAPYILHCLAVMEMAGERVKDHNREVVMVTAVLHDALEDFKGSTTAKRKLKDDICHFFGARVSLALNALTKYPRQGGYQETYDEYLDRIDLDWIARVVKVCDLTHNMDPRRIPATQIVDKDFQRWDKYRRALIRLERS